MSNPNLGRDEAATRSEQIDVSTYEVQVDVTAAKDQSRDHFPVVSTVFFTSTAPETWLDFLDGEVASVVVNEVEVDIDYDGARIWLRDLRTTGLNKVTVVGQGRYSRSGQGLHRFVDPVDGETYLYTQYEPADSRRVFPNFEQPDLKASYIFTLLGPTDWQLLVNQPEVAREEVGAGNVLVTFAPTPLLSTYITAIAAGPYARWDDVWERDGLTIPLGLLCRQSLAEYLDTENFFTVTKQGMDFFDEAFGYRYPWGKYDQILVPEYNLGAMENPGLVTFTERYIFRSHAVRAQYAGRANTILHEMSHMWFGDLVTPKWWDDLWLKESFAEYMGAHSSVAATEFTDAWVGFAGGRKLWAAMQDQLPTTHPIVADIPNLEAAKQNFDGITYAKGAAVLKQLVNYVGVDEFFAGARAYFQRHAFGATRFADLLRALEEACGRDLKAWAARWLETAGIDTLTPVVTLDGDAIAELRIEQTSTDPRTGEATNRPHRLGIGLFALQGDQLERYAALDVEVPGDGCIVEEAKGLRAPDLVLLNDRDLSYAKIRFDKHSLATLSAHLPKLTDPLARALVWAALTDMTRDAELPAKEFLAIVGEHGPSEADSAVVMALLSNCLLFLGYVPQGERAGVRAAFTEQMWRNLQAAEPGSDTQTLWARGLTSVGLSEQGALPHVRAILAGAINGLDVSPELRWSCWAALAAHGQASDAELDAEQERDRTADGARMRTAAWYGRPDAALKAEAWEKLHTPRALSNDHVDAMIAGFDRGAHRELTRPYDERYYADLEKVWGEHAIEISQRLVRGLFPLEEEIERGGDVEAHPAVARAQRWIDEHPEAPGALRRIVLEQTDHLRRRLRAQAVG